MFTYDPRPSPVDASLLERLTLEQIEEIRLIEIMDLLQYSEYIMSFECSLDPHSDWSRSYRFSFSHESMRVRVRAYFYWSEQRLIDYLPRLRRQFTQQHSLVVENDNNTQVFLHASINQRSHGAPLSWRSIRTELRLGNVHITLSEDRDRNSVYPNASTAFIQLLYELLTAE